MEPFKRIMVAVDNTETDERLFKYTAFLCDLLKPEIVYFIHAIDFEELPKQFRSKFPELEKPKDEVIKRNLKDKSKEFFTAPEGVDVKFEIREGKPPEVIDKWSEFKNIDLLVVGHKEEKSGSGVTPQHLTRKINCSVLFVPDEDINLKMRVIHTPSDFSEFSKLSVRQAINIAKVAPEKCAVVVQHVYDVPDQYYKTGKSYEEFSKIMKENAQTEYNKFIKEIDTKGINISCAIHEEKKHNEVKHIINFANYLQTDLLIIGAKGKSGAAAFFLGSVTETLIKTYFNIPLLVIKDKSRKFGLLDFIKNI